MTDRQRHQNPDRRPTSSAGASQRLRINVRGLVQGVGFRPFVYRQALKHGLTGWVRNNASGVEIQIEGERQHIDDFCRALRDDLPQIARIDHSDSVFIDPSGESEFTVLHSDTAGSKSSTVLPDLALCNDCLREMFDPANRRYRYPFINCTNCGPRYSIMEGIPYDRDNTTMRVFHMCDECRAEYEDPANRRFHAQPNACPVCGPHVEFWSHRGDTLASLDDAVTLACRELRNGSIVAMKGLGGFQLIVDASNEDAVSRLRQRKAREDKPFALMYPHIESIELDCLLTGSERTALLSTAAPIVLVHRRKPRYTDGPIAPSVAPDNPYLGVMLPYTPIHHLLLSDLGSPVIATSGNRSDEPICTSEADSLSRLGDIADYFLVHNRPIARPVDDSVVQLVDDDVMVLRSARGFAPVSIDLPSPCKPVLAVGAHLKNTIACSVGDRAVVSQHIGDLDTKLTIDALRNTVEITGSLFGIQPKEVSADLHPDYESTRFAELLDLPTTRVQHHLAHILSCMIENKIAPPALGVAWDGTGLGTDGTIWGGEFLLMEQDSCRRYGSFYPFRLPGGEQAIREARRSALAVLCEAFGDTAESTIARLMPRVFSDTELSALLTMTTRAINSPLTSSAGRLFDAIASLCGISHVSRFEGQSAMKLQFAAEMASTNDKYPIDFLQQGSILMFDWRPLVRDIVSDLGSRLDISVIARKFHLTLAEVIAEAADRIGANRVALSGGCFQNRLLLENTIRAIRERSMHPFWQRSIPSNDGGISLGQIAAAALAYTEVN